MKDQKITAVDLQAAVKKFVRSGGIIRKLPAQKALLSKKVGQRWNASELGGELG